MKPSARELETLLAIAEGNSVEWTAHHLGISKGAVHAYLIHILERYGVPNKEAAIAVALAKKDIRVSPLDKKVSLKEDELDLLDRIALGQEDKVLSAELFWHTSVIDRRVGVVLAKLGAVNRINGVYLAFRCGLLTGYQERQIKKARQSEIKALAAIAHTADIYEAGEILEISPLSVKAYVERARRRLGAKNTPHAVYIALKRKEINCPQIRSRDNKLSEREQQALLLVAQGLENKDIAVRLGITLRTTNRTIPEALEKLGAKSRPHAVSLLFAYGILC